MAFSSCRLDPLLIVKYNNQTDLQNAFISYENKYTTTPTTKTKTGKSDVEFTLYEHFGVMRVSSLLNGQHSRLLNQYKLTVNQLLFHDQDVLHSSRLYVDRLLASLSSPMTNEHLVVSCIKQAIIDLNKIMMNGVDEHVGEHEAIEQYNNMLHSSPHVQSKLFCCC